MMPGKMMTPLRMSFSVMICESLLELGQTTIERARGDALAHRFDTDAQENTNI